VIESEYRGRSFSRRIVEALVDHAGGRKIYATSVSTCVPMHRALIACGFVREGIEWQSERRSDETLFLFVHYGREQGYPIGGGPKVL
jgi:RimJ/RimL family protein N-acetyltransferase